MKLGFYQGTTCPSFSGGAGGGGFGGGNAGLFAGTGGLYGSTAGGTMGVAPGTKKLPNGSETIINNITNPCISAAYTRLVNNDLALYSYIHSALTVNFGINTNYNITYSSFAFTPDMGNAASNTDPRVTTNIKVSLNENFLAGASLERISETILHESIHGILSASPGGVDYLNASRQHEAMYIYWINLEINDLMSAYAYLSQKDATALVLAGFGDIQANDPTFFNRMLAQQGISLSDIVTIRDSYEKSGTAGTRCK